MGTQSKNILRICSYDALRVCDALRDLKRRSNDRSKRRSNFSQSVCMAFKLLSDV